MPERAQHWLLHAHQISITPLPRPESETTSHTWLWLGDDVHGVVLLVLLVGDAQLLTGVAEVVLPAHGVGAQVPLAAEGVALAAVAHHPMVLTRQGARTCACETDR